MPTTLNKQNKNQLTMGSQPNRAAEPKVEACSLSHTSPSKDKPLAEPHCQGTVPNLVLETG